MTTPPRSRALLLSLLGGVAFCAAASAVFAQAVEGANSSVAALDGVLRLALSPSLSAGTIPSATIPAGMAPGAFDPKISAFLDRAREARLSEAAPAAAAAPVPTAAASAAPVANEAAAVYPSAGAQGPSVKNAAHAETLAKISAALAPFAAEDIRGMPADALEALARRVWDDMRAHEASAQGPKASGPDWARGVFLPRTFDRPLPNDPLAVTVHRLSNGLTVYLAPNDKEPRVHYNIAVRAGSRHDPLEATGMAHYLEHMQFKGTQRLGTVDYEREKVHLDRIEALYDRLFDTKEPARRAEIYAEIDRESQAAAEYAVPNEIDRLYKTLGFDHINAHTFYEETVYEGEFPSNRREVWALTETARLRDPVYRIFQPELETIYKEYNMGQDDPGRALFTASLAAAFPDHPYGRSVIGLGEHLKNPSLSRMQKFFKERYRPNNMALTLSGDFDRAEMLALLERTFGRLEPAPVPPGPAAELRPLHGVERSEILMPDEEAVAINWRLPGRNSPDEDALILMDKLMSNRSAGILDLTLNKAQKVKSAESYPFISGEAGAWMLFVSPKDGQTLEEAERAGLEAVERLKAGDFSEEELAAARGDLEVGEKKKLETNEARVLAMQESFINGAEWEDAAGREERLKRLTKADIVRVANRYLGDDRAVVYRRKGSGEHENVQAPALAPIQIDSSRSSAYARELAGLPAENKEPRFLTDGRDYKTSNHDWGRLYWTPGPGNRLSELELRFDLGVVSDGRVPLAVKLLELSGAGDMSVDDFQKSLYRLGTTLTVGSGDRELSVKLSGPDENLREALRLTLLRFARPNVAPGAFAEMISVERGARKDREADANQVFWALQEFATRGADSPVLHELSARKLDELREDELKAVLRSVFEFKRDALYSGDLKPEEVVSILQPASGTRSAPEPAPARLLSPTRTRVVFVHRPDLRQSLVGAYAADGRYDPAARADSRLYSTLMGDMNGVYFQEMRESRALAYTAAGGHDLGSRAGDDNRVWAFISAQADQTLEAMKLMLSLMTDPPLTAARFAAGVRQAIEQYRTIGIPIRELPQALLGWARQGFRADDPRAETFRELLNYRREGLDAFIARFKGKPMTVYVVGDRSRVDIEGLKKLGDFEELQLGDIFPY